MDRVPDSGSEGRGFESLQARQKPDIGSDTIGIRMGVRFLLYFPLADFSNPVSKRLHSDLENVVESFLLLLPPGNRYPIWLDTANPI